MAKIIKANKKIVIYGSNTMAGHVLDDYLSKIEGYEVLVADESMLFNNDQLKIIQNSIVDNVDIAINCIRCLVEESESNLKKAELYNHKFPKYIEKHYKLTKSRIVHLSTDCVFSGKLGNYNEEHKPDGKSIYSITKASGEINNHKDVTIRTSYIGPNIGKSSEELFHWFIKLKNESISGYSNAYWNGVTTLELAKNIHKIIEKKITGIYHLVPNGNLSKYELLLLIKEIWKRNDININIDNSVSYNRTLADNRKLLNVSDFNTMLKELFNYMMDRKNIYNQYF